MKAMVDATASTSSRSVCPTATRCSTARSSRPLPSTALRAGHEDHAMCLRTVEVVAVDRRRDDGHDLLESGAGLWRRSGSPLSSQLGRRPVGLITPDLIPDEGAEWIRRQRRSTTWNGFFLVAPSSTPKPGSPRRRAGLPRLGLCGVDDGRDRRAELRRRAPHRLSSSAPARSSRRCRLASASGVSNGAQAAEVADLRGRRHRRLRACPPVCSMPTPRPAGATAVRRAGC